MRLLFTDPAKEFHLRELSRLSSLALGTIQQEVGKLARADLLVARRDGNRLYYRANTGHPIFSELQGIALKTTGLREQLADALAGVRRIAYNAALKLCTILFYAEGCRPEKNLAHYRTLQALPFIMGPKRKDDADYLDSCRSKRETPLNMIPSAV